MSLDEFLKNPLSRWLGSGAPDSDIILSSRIRLARNLEEFPFPLSMNQQQAEEVIKRVEQALAAPEIHERFGLLALYRLDALSPLDRQVAVEKHLISPQHAAEGQGRAVAIKDDESISLMVNEEDHLRMQFLMAGLQLEKAWETANVFDDALEGRITYAFDPQRGYLTACPTNVGTGLRASVMAHLPALVMTNQAGPIFASITKLGMVVRGLFGEGSQAAGNIFQISNQITLGQSESEIITKLTGITRQIIGQERAAREILQREMHEQLEDRICRSYGILSNARIMSSEEAMRLWSDVRLGIDLEMVSGISPAVLNELLVAVRPNYLQKLSGKELNPFERDLRRAALIRGKLERQRSDG
ncbi:MAG: protein arginine kinase [Firmicutes bacterium]|nr:protein arginine kinase [Bacillota bacterium]